jgi:hypothetical protein
MSIQLFYTAIIDYDTETPLLNLYSNTHLEMRRGTASIVPWLSKLSTINELLSFDEFKQFLDDIKRVLTYEKLSINSQLKAKSHVKKWIRNVYDNEIANDVKFFDYYYNESGLTITKEEFDEKRAQSNTAVTLKNTHVLNVSHEKIELFAKNLIDKTRDTVDNIILAQLASGARLIEVLQPKVSEWGMIKSTGEIQQTGTAKSPLVKRVIIKFPIFIDGVTFLMLIISIRKDLAKYMGYSNTSFTSYINTKLNARIYNYFRNVNIDSPVLSSTHNLRALYVAYSYYIRENKDESFLQFYKTKLGHLSFDSIANYASLNIT